VPLWSRSSLSLISLSCVLVLCTVAAAQAPAALPPVTLTTDQDRQNMMDQLVSRRCGQDRAGTRKPPTTLIRTRCLLQGHVQEIRGISLVFREMWDTTDLELKCR
jgi:hypothetical protein